MHSRAMGTGRRLALVGALMVVVGCLLPWYTVGGDGGLPPVTYRAFTYLPGLVVFLSALGTIALIALPFAMGPRHLGIDRGLTFGILAALAIAGIVLWVLQVMPAPQGLMPGGAYGFWISAVGAVILGRAAFDISREPPRL